MASKPLSTASIPGYAKSIASAIAEQDGQSLRGLFELGNHELVRSLYASLSHSVINSYNELPHHSDFVSAIRTVDFENAGRSPWAAIASRHISTIIQISKTDTDPDGKGEKAAPAWEQAYLAQLEAVKAFIPWFQSGVTGWALPVLYVLCRDLKQMAIQADFELARAKEKATKLEEASRHITKGWTACLSDRTSLGEVSRKHGTYYMATLLFKIYFKLETLSLCKNIVRGIQNIGDLPPLSSFPMSHQVTYRYYLGIFDFLNERYEGAEEHLAFAFQHCHRRSYRNQERILSYLIPLRLLRGVLPSKLLLGNFPRLSAFYEPFISSYRIGDLKKYDDSLLEHRGELVKRGTFLVIERAREGCLRTLFKRVWLCSGRDSRLPVSTAQRSLAYVNVDVDSVEVECLIANLIYKGHLKGYISHEKQTVVLAKDRPFPAIIGKTL